MEQSKASFTHQPDSRGWTIHLQYAELAHVGSSYTTTQIMVTQTTMIVLLEGSCQLKKKSQIIPMKMDTLYICYPGTTFELLGAEDSPLVAVLRVELYEPVNTQGGVLRAVSQYIPQLLAEETVHPVPGAAGDHCRSICASLRAGDSVHRLRAQLLTMELVLEVASSSTLDQSSHVSGVERVKQYMEEHPNESVNAEKLAQLAGLSPKHFAKQFKKTYGKSAREYLTDLRLSKAKRLMLRADRRLKDVAHEVGYQDEFYFSRLFKKEFGISPSSYLHKRRRKIAAYACASTLGYLLPLEQIPYLAPLHPKWTNYYLERYGADIPCHLEYGVIDNMEHPNMQRMAEAEPDIIVCPDYISPLEYERLSAIGEVVKLPQELPGAWKDGLRRLGSLLDVSEDAEYWIRRFEMDNQQARNLLSRGGHNIKLFGGSTPSGQTSGTSAPSVLFVRMIRGQLLGLDSPGTLDYIYNELGIRRPRLTPKDDNSEAPVVWEQLEAEDVDYVALLIRQDSETLEQWQALSRSSDWCNLRVVREQRLRMLSSSPWREYSPLALERIREDLLQQLLSDTKVHAESVLNLWS